MKVSLWAEIRRLHEIEAMKGRDIAKKLGCSRYTISRALSMNEPPLSKPRSPRSKRIANPVRHLACLPQFERCQFMCRVSESEDQSSHWMLYYRAFDPASRSSVAKHRTSRAGLSECSRRIDGDANASVDLTDRQRQTNGSRPPDAHRSEHSRRSCPATAATWRRRCRRSGKSAITKDSTEPSTTRFLDREFTSPRPTPA